MIARSLKDFLEVGYRLRYLLDVSVEHPIYGENRVLETMRGMIGACFELGLRVTSRAAERLYGPQLKKWQRPGDQGVVRLDATLSVHEVAAIREASYQLQTVLFSEAEGVFAYVAMEKRYRLDRLIDDLPELMAPDVFRSLPEIAQSDFRAAGRCIAFELPTAAAFHLMRGTEDALKEFYRRTTKDTQSRLMWGAMVDKLKRQDDPPPAVLLNILDNLRSGFRNPTQHPEKIYDIEEAQDLLSLSIDAVNRMARHLHRLETAAD
jgi:hypothetical protein